MLTPDEDIMENNYMFVILLNLSVICHLIFPQCFFRPGNPSQGIPLPIAIVSCRTTFKNVVRCVHSISLSPPKQLVSQVYIEIAYHTV